MRGGATRQWWVGDVAHLHWVMDDMVTREFTMGRPEVQ